MRFKNPEIKNTHTSLTLLWVCVFFVFLSAFLFPLHAHAERIGSYVSNINLSPDSSFVVQEKIQYDFQAAQKHGIFRCISTKHHDKASSFFKERYVDLTVTKVVMDDQDVPYTLSEESDQLCIKIGDPQSQVTGAHTYTITYTAAGGLTYEKFGGVDLYWNVNGNGWEVPIDSIEVHVSGPEGFFRRERSCYRGIEGETGSCGGMYEDVEGIHFKATLLKPGEGITIAQSLERAKVMVDTHERYNIIWFIIAGLIILFATSGVAAYRYKTEFETGDTIIPQYEPFTGVKPMYTGLLMDGRLDARDITAGIVYLAQQGFLQIRREERKVFFLFEVDDYEITLTKAPDETFGKFDRRLLQILFGVEYPSVGSRVALHELKDSTATRQRNSQIIQTLRQDVANDLISAGFYSGLTFKIKSVVLIVIILLTMLGASYFKSEISGLIFIVGLVSAALFSLLSTRRTRLGYEALDPLTGFNDFLSVTESQRYIFHNAPERNATQFMEFLPYAIAFGVEKEWAMTFKGITIPNPNWYDGGGNAHAFSAIGLTQSIGGFSSAFTSASGSASSGGGSSGGGSGGGGGGSW